MLPYPRLVTKKVNFESNANTSGRKGRGEKKLLFKALGRELNAEGGESLNVIFNMCNQ